MWGLGLWPPGISLAGYNNKTNKMMDGSFSYRPEAVWVPQRPWFSDHTPSHSEAYRTSYYKIFIINNNKSIVLIQNSVLPLLLLFTWEEAKPPLKLLKLPWPPRVEVCTVKSGCHKNIVCWKLFRQDCHWMWIICSNLAGTCVYGLALSAVAVVKYEWFVQNVLGLC